MVEVCAGLDEKLEHTLATAEHSTYEHRPPAYSMAGATQSATSRDPTCEHRHLGTNVHGMWIAAPSKPRTGTSACSVQYPVWYRGDSMGSMVSPHGIGRRDVGARGDKNLDREVVPVIDCQH